jgi:outer membrane protein OmpA-like peptidoglycan-associated protein
MAKVNKVLLYSFLLMFVSILCSGAEIHENKGVVDASLLKGSFLSVTDPAYGMFYNPAVFARIGETEVSGGRSGLYVAGGSYAKDIYEGFVAAAQARDKFGWGLGLHYKGLGKDALDVPEEKDITDFRTYPGMDYSEISAIFSMGKKAFIYRDKKGRKHSFTGGFHIKYHNVSTERDTLDDSYNAIAFDIGIIGSPSIPDVPEIRDLRIGLAWENAVSKILSDDFDSNRVSSHFRLSGSCFIGDKFQPAIDFRHNGVSLSGSYWLMEGLSGRGFITVPSSGGSVIGIGANKKIDNYIIDVAVKDQKDVGVAVNVSLRGYWGELDKCPGEEEDMDGFQDEDGCPDYDNDNDGILDENDECPLQPGEPSNNGCPFVDDDNDGVPNNKDNCINTPEDIDKFEDDDGCPDLDNDGDRIPDSEDECPIKAETMNQYKDDDGCPDDFFEEWENVEFEGRTDVPKPDSYNNLYGIVMFMQDNEEITIEVVAYNTDKDLAQRQADSIKTFLVNSGISEDRIVATGEKGDRSYMKFNNLSSE